MNEQNKKLLKVKDVAELLGITEAAVRKRIFLGQIPRMKLGHNVYVPTTRLLEFINKRTLEPK